MNLLDDRKEAEAACEIAEANDCNGSGTARCFLLALKPSGAY
jgi:hypothetical protein